jgi:hypothetical protein
MSAAAGKRIDQRALAEILIASGVTVTPDEVDSVDRALARLDAAAAVLLASPSFDETVERFLRLLDQDGTDGGGA